MPNDTQREVQPELPIEGEGSARQKLDEKHADGLRYRRIRTEELRLTTEALAEILGITKRSIQQREAGLTTIRPEHWHALASVNQEIQRRRVNSIIKTPKQKLEFAR